MTYQPEQIYIDRYAAILVKYALNSGDGIKPNEVVFLQVPESAKLLLLALNRAVLQAGAHPIIQYVPDEMERQFFDYASNHQLEFFPTAFYKGRAIQADHTITIIAETNKHELEGIDPKKIMTRRSVRKPYQKWLNTKENNGKYTWTLGLYPTESMAKEAGMTLEECWSQVIKACYLDYIDPVTQWKSLTTDLDRLKQKLNKLKITTLRLTAVNTDLTIKLGPARQWLGGSGRNIPSFELFISPDWRGTEGYIYFDQPLYYAGQVIKDIALEFKKGLVVNATAKVGQDILTEMIKVKNANKIGEYSLTDTRFSRIDKYMAETLYDENFGGHYGNTHLALGSAYQESFTGNITRMKAADWTKHGFNQSVIHTDIIATTPRLVEATLIDNTNVAIYRDGRFLM